MTEFLHIAPTRYLNTFCAHQTVDLLLAHLLESDPNYLKFYQEKKRDNPNVTYIMDNSGFEIAKHNVRDFYTTDELIRLALMVQADYIVIPDYPGESYLKGIVQAQNDGEEIRKAGFKTFFVPQGTVGSLEELIQSFAWAAHSPLIDYIGVSILAAPNAFGVEKDNQLQRFMSRWKIMRILEEEGILAKIKFTGKKIHFLGMVDGPNEIEVVEKYLKDISTWDSSSAVWAGLFGLSYDKSPSGLIKGKFEKPVDFNFSSYVSPEYIDIAFSNMNHIRNLLDKGSK